MVRLNKFLAERMGLSRREADNLIALGQVLVDGKKAELGTRVTEGQKVQCGGQTIPFENQYIYLALNKPVGYVSSKKRQGDTPTLYELLPQKYQHLKTVGRLDKDSSGLILLTNDGDFSFQMTHPKFIKTKLYEVTLDHALTPLHQQEIADFGINLPDGLSQLGLEKLNETRKKWLVTMSEGRNRQIRRTFAALGYRVQKLHRIQFGKYRLGGLKSGDYQEVPKV